MYIDFCFLACSASSQEVDPSAASANAEGASLSDGKGVEISAPEDASSHGANAATTGAEPLVKEKGKNDVTSEMDEVSQEVREGKMPLYDREETTARRKATKEEKAAERMLKAKM